MSITFRIATATGDRAARECGSVLILQFHHRSLAYRTGPPACALLRLARQARGARVRSLQRGKSLTDFQGCRGGRRRVKDERCPQFCRSLRSAPATTKSAPPLPASRRGGGAPRP